MSRAHLSRRSLLRTGLAVSATGVLLGGTRSALAEPAQSVQRELRALEREHDARLGVHATNTRTGATVTYRAHERFPMCSTFKTLAAAAIVRDHDILDKRIRYTDEVLVPGSPITEQHVGAGMRVDDLCAAAICYSDNTAANLLLHELGGPRAITRFCRSIGDPVTRLDRWEIELNTAFPGDPRDTTTPDAIGRDYRRLVLGDALRAGDRAQLTSWLRANTTSTNRFVAGLPKHWTIGDKTGSGDYGTTNDVGIAWTGAGTPIVLATLSTKFEQDADYDDLLIADAARILARTLAPGE
ncbi:class A beta-lactamase [Prauserella cavernicola]|uniref:Beta-lactamase n=1 Tax=Prauserella cavernicola TaxID=2800127 RepID=A0A934QQI9_9PSEU|nr:class A beta-lactamase [Prauserella cavernicola]MBK1784306.1 class A beta-lactamase [Prauserella cavernicola]